MITTSTRMARKRPRVIRPLVPAKAGTQGHQRRENWIPACTGMSARFTAPALYRLMAWLSPAYPVGAFSYSSGIEWAVEAGDVTSAKTLCQWLGDDAGRRRRLLRRRAVRACLPRLRDRQRRMRFATVAELAAALAPSRERFLETTAQGRAFSRQRVRPGPARHSIASPRSMTDRSPIRSRWPSPPQGMSIAA